MTKLAKTKSRMAINSLILAFGVIFAKVIGVAYRIPLVNLLGAEGIGIYQQIFAVFAFLLTLIGGALPIAISKLVSEKITYGDNEGAYELFVGTKKSVLLISILASVGLCFLAKPISILQGNSAIELGYFSIAPSIALVAIIGVYRGYYQGIYSAHPTTISQIIEQLFKLLLGLYLAKILMPKGLMFAVCGALLGTTVSEVIALLYFIIKYKNDFRHIKYKVKSFKLWNRELMKIVIPMTIASIIIPLTQLIDNVLIVSVLTYGGVDNAIATSYYGLFTGASSTIINMPVILALSVAIAAVPILSSGKANKDMDIIKIKSRMSIKTTYAIGVFSAFFFYIGAEFILKFLFSNLTNEEIKIASSLLKIGGLGIIFVIELQIHTSILQALGKVDEPIYNLLVASLIKIFFTLLLCYYLSIVGAAIANVISYFVGSLLNHRTMKKYLGKDDEITKSTAKTLLAGIIMASTISIFGYFLKNELIKFAFYVIVGFVIYITLLFIFKVFKKTELKGLPIFNKLIKDA